jgi:hypothetical protein
MVTELQVESSLATAIALYIQAWNSQDPTDRFMLLQKCFHKEGIYVDPHAGRLRGLEAMHGLIGRFRDRFPHQLVASSEIQQHNRCFRMHWVLQDAEEGILSRGLFVGDLAMEHQIIYLLVFLE